MNQEMENIDEPKKDKTTNERVELEIQNDRIFNEQSQT